NAAIQDVILEVEESYYLYVNARALAQAEATSVKEAEASLDAAETRRRAGLGTIADVLQAKTVLSRARLALETAEGEVSTIRGALATAMGLPANTGFDVTLPPLEPPKDDVAVEIERALREAQERRPDLAAARAEVERAEADLRARSASDRPSLNLVGSGGQSYYWLTGLHQNVYNTSLVLTIPIFNGLTYHYNVFKAEADRDVARARLAALEQDVTLQVWTSYYRHRTAVQKVATSGDLLESAAQGFEVVSARYRAGVGSILDLLTAQSALEGARAEQTRGRTEWYLTLAQLAHDTGALATPVAEPAHSPGSGAEGTP
ncbi:MAG TPA: TolC family protein, partial [Verrucomicrobiae bacterium]|nr:TolC family protein [Verrucomicrobiae bacterium]